MSLEILTYGWTSVFDVDKRQCNIIIIILNIFGEIYSFMHVFRNTYIWMDFCI